MAARFSTFLLAFCIIFTLAPWTVHGHGRMIIPIGREGSTDAPITDLPCNNLPAGDSVATFVAGAKTQLAYSITEVHDPTSTCYIDIASGSGDGSFTKIATLEQCASYLGTYVANVQFPTDITGKATLRWWWHVQSINVTFATCSDITVVNGSS